MKRESILKKVLYKLSARTLTPSQKYPDPIIQKLTAVTLAFTHIEVEEDGDKQIIKGKDSSSMIEVNEKKKEVKFKGTTGDMMYVMKHAEELGYQFKRI